MKFKVRSIIALFLLGMGVVAWLPSLLVSADVTNPVISIVAPPTQDYKNSGSGVASLTDATIGTGAIVKAVDDINSELESKGIFVNRALVGNKQVVTFEPFIMVGGSSDVCDITVVMTRYNKLANSEQQKVMQIALDGIYNSDISRTNKNKIYNELCELDSTTASLVRQLSSDVRADFANAYSWFKPFSSPIGTLLGVLTIVIFISLGLTAVIDIAYIVLPPFQMFLGKVSKGEKTILVSLEAANAVKEAESKSGQEFVEPLSVYFKSKIKQYVILAICIIYLVSGEIFNLISSWIDYFSGVL